MVAGCCHSAVVSTFQIQPGVSVPVFSLKVPTASSSECSVQSDWQSKPSLPARDDDGDNQRSEVANTEDV